MTMPKPGVYRRKFDGSTVTVTGCTGPSDTDRVSVERTTVVGTRKWQLQVRIFARRYEPTTNPGVPS